jgi:uncharacterized protein (UPF0254 family)
MMMISSVHRPLRASPTTITACTGIRRLAVHLVSSGHHMVGTRDVETVIIKIETTATQMRVSPNKFGRR